jgi:hypothetical protein
MVTFLDGPAKCETLQLRRVPQLLRVVRSRQGEWDALDQLDDEPKATETIVVYRRRDDLQVSRYHILTGRPRRAGSGFYWMASYSVLPDQPADDQVRETAAWRAWATAWLARG